MLPLPRLALGTIQADARVDFVCWALLEALKREQCQVQHFVSRCSFVPLDGVLPATGLSSRHLDSWLMTPESARELLVHGTASCELALVEGCYDCGRPDGVGGSSLDQLCAWLNLPRLAVIDVSLLHHCRLPERPPVDGLLLDRVGDHGQFCRWQTQLESLWGIPVLGALEDLSRLRFAVDAVPAGSQIAHDILHALGNSFLRNADLAAIRRLAASRPMPDGSAGLFDGQHRRRPLKVAVAYDDAFNCYFPDAFDLLEAMGATLTDFSPLHDEQLPAGAELVYIGCGHPERHAADLSANHCMMSALRNHLCAGKRIYADGGGLAYLCQSLEGPEGDSSPMVGALPAIARSNPAPAGCQPVEFEFARSCWLGQTGTRVRGYRSSRWQLEPAGPLRGLFAQPGCEHDMVGCFRAVASSIQINFATQPGFLQTFFEPLKSLEPASALAASP